MNTVVAINHMTRVLMKTECKCGFVMNVGFIVTVVKIITRSRKCENVNGVQIEWEFMIQSVKECIMIGDQSVTGRPIVFVVLESVTNGTQQMRWYVVEIVMKFTRELHKCKVLLGSRINWWYPLLLFAYSAPQGEIGLSAFESH